MTALCTVAGCRQIITGRNLPSQPGLNETNRLYTEFIDLQNHMGMHLSQHHPEHWRKLNEFANTAGTYFISKCFESSDPQFSECCKRQGDYLRSLISASFSMDQRTPDPQTLNIETVGP